MIVMSHSCDQEENPVRSSLSILINLFHIMMFKKHDSIWEAHWSKQEAVCPLFIHLAEVKSIVITTQLSTLQYSLADCTN